MIRTLIVDDEEMARASLQMMCEKIEDIEIVGVCETGLQAMKLIKETEVDLILLDIQMPDLSGMDLVKSLTNLPQIIFTTGHKEYALEAFEYHVSDFLIKPIEFPRLLKAVEHVKASMDKVPAGPTKELFVKVDGRYIRINLDDVLYVESLGDYVTFVTLKNKYIVHSTLKNIDDKIKNEQFLKVHRSFIVNLSKVVDIEESNMVIHDKVIPISRSQKPVLMSRIKTV